EREAYMFTLLCDALTEPALITPEVVPFIRDQGRLAEYLDSNSVDYLITFPSLYPRLTSQRKSLFEAGLEFEPIHFEENMHVYRWK
ncbi:MAG TPA: hypothetical protein VK206_07090, partial [Anaerolineales bacterium]|nr:hypothetical protein [Anaerolineales bacterium]